MGHPVKVSRQPPPAHFGKLKKRSSRRNLPNCGCCGAVSVYPSALFSYYKGNSQPNCRKIHKTSEDPCISAPEMEFDASKYIPTIDAILQVSDLQVVTAKRIRNSLQELFGVDLNPYKDEMNQVVLSRFHALLNKRKEEEAAKSGDTVERNSDAENSSEAVNEPNSTDKTSDNTEKTVKNKTSGERRETETKSTNGKVKQTSIEAEDTLIAARLHAAMNAPRLRSERRKPKPKQREKKPKSGKRKKSAAYVSDDDLSGSDGDPEADSSAVTPEPTTKRKRGGLQQPLKLSPALAEFIGEDEMSRPQIVSRIWDYVKKNGLQNPSDKREILCDEALKPVFGDKVNMFQMNKVIAKHVYKPDEVVGGE